MIDHINVKLYLISMCRLYFLWYTKAVMVMASRGLGMLEGYLVCDASSEILHSHITIIMLKTYSLAQFESR